MEYEIVEDSSMSFYELFEFFKKRLWIIILAMVIGGILSFIGFSLFEEDQYQSEAQLIVNQQRANETIQYSEIQTNVSLISTYRQIILGKSVLEEVIELTDPSLTMEGLRQAISVEQIEDAQTFNIVAVMDSPELAQNVVQNLIFVFEDTLTGIYDTDILNIYVISSPSYQPETIKTGTITRILIGAVLGAILAVGVILLRELLDNTVKDDSYLQQFGIIKLGELSSLSDKEYDEALLHPASRKGRS